MLNRLMLLLANDKDFYSILKTEYVLPNVSVSREAATHYHGNGFNFIGNRVKVLILF